MAGSRNITTQSLDQQLQQSLKKLWSEFLQLKNRQPIGADVLELQSLPTSSTVLAFPGGSTTTTIPAGGVFNIVWHWTPSGSTLTLWNFLVSLYVDPTSFNGNGIADYAHHYPDGSGITAGVALNVKVSTWIDWAASSDSTNMRALIVNVVNNDSVSHEMAIYIKAYLPNLNQTL